MEHYAPWLIMLCHGKQGTKWEKRGEHVGVTGKVFPEV